MPSDSSPPPGSPVDRDAGSSRHVDRFNHDEDAVDYDQDVQRDSDPIRAGYEDLLDWVAAQVADLRLGPILELGSGTGNLTRRLPRVDIVCVDISREMTRKLQEKMASSDARVRIEIADVLAYVRRAATASYRAVVSTYTLHHLEEDEKATLFAELQRILMPSGRFVVGDLMFEHAAARRRFLDEQRRRDRDQLVEVIEDEFFWDVDRSLEGLRDVGFEVSPAVAFSDLSWGIAARRPASAGRD